MSAPSDVSSSPSSLPVQLSQLLHWTSARLRQFDQDASVTSESNIPGCPLVTARQIPGQGYGIVVTRDITVEENRRDGDGIELMRATPEMQLRMSGSRIKEILPKEDSWLAFCLALLHEFSLESKSEYADYFPTLPQRLDLPMFWTEPQLAELRGCTFIDRIDFFDWPKEWKETVLPFMEQHPKLFNLKICTFELWKRIQGWILSRAFRPKGTYQDLGPHLLPIISLANTTSLKEEDETNEKEEEEDHSDHSPKVGINTRVEWVWPSSSESVRANSSSSTSAAAASVSVSAVSSLSSSLPSLVVKTIPGHAYTAGEQVFIPYGSPDGLPNHALLTRYGFVQDEWPRRENECDEITIDLERIVQLVHGHVEGMASTETSQTAQDEEDAEAREVQKEKRKKQKAAASSSSPSSIPGSDSHVDADSDSDSDDDACGTGVSYHAHLEFAGGLPSGSLTVPSSGAMPDLLKMFLGVLTGELAPDTVGHLWQRQDWERRMKEASERRKRIIDQQQTPASQEQSPSPPPIEELAVGGERSSSSSSSPSFDFDDEEMSMLIAEEQELGFSPDMAASIHKRTLAQVDASPDVYTHAFLLFHHLLEQYSTTLEEDVKLLQTVDEWMVNEDDDNQRRKLLALKVRMGEKRILHRALSEVKMKLAQLEIDDIGHSDEDDNDEYDEGGSIPPHLLVQRALQEAGEVNEGDEIEMGDEHFADPNIVDPALIEMLSNQRRNLKRKDRTAKDDQGDGDADANDDTDAAELVSPEPASGLKLTYTYTKSSADRTKKKRRG